MNHSTPALAGARARRSACGLVLTLVATLASSSSVAAVNIDTIAGTGIAGYSGENGPAKSAMLNKPTSIAFDAAGNRYIADFVNQRIRKVDSAGVITTVAGRGVAGYGGDGLQATSAYLNYPTGIAVDSAGNLYIGDQNNHRIRKVAPSGIINTIAGTGTPGYNGDGIAATSAWLNRPTNIAVDPAGNVYFTEYGGHRLRKISTSGIISTVAGTGVGGYNGDGILAASAQLNGPTGVSIDTTGNIYIADYLNSRVRKIAGGIISTVAGTGTAGYNGDGGLATSAQLFYPYEIAAVAGVLYIADFGNCRIRKVSSNGIITTIVGTGVAGSSGDLGPPASAQVNAPISVGVAPSGSLHVVEYLGHRVREVPASIATYAGSETFNDYGGDGGPATSALLSFPYDVAVDASGNAFIADTGNHCVRRVDGTTGIITSFAGTCTAYGNSGNGGPATTARLNAPSGVAVDSQGSVYIAERNNHCIRKVTGGIIYRVAGTCGVSGVSGENVPATSAFLSQPHGITLDSQGNLYIADSGNNRVRKVATTGIISTVATGFNFPADVALSQSGSQLYVADYYNHRIAKVEGGLVTTVAGTGLAGSSGDGGPATSAQINRPGGVLIDATGAMYISEFGGNRVRKVTYGTIQTYAGNGSLGVLDDVPPTVSGIAEPLGLAMDSLQGSLFIAAQDSNRILRVRLP